jgi:hypothetical protein
MKARVKKNAYILSFFILFLVFIGAILFIVFFESGIISLNSQPVKVSSLSCTFSGTTINIYKGVEQPVNLTKVILKVGSAEYVLLNSNLEINGGMGYYSFDFPYRCISAESVQASVYYESYSSVVQSFSSGNNFFSGLISDTRA